VVVLLGFAATSAVFFEVRREERADFRARFESISTTYAHRLTSDMEEGLNLMQAVARFSQRTGHVYPEDLRAMTSSFLPTREELGGVGWLPACGTSLRPALYLDREGHGSATSGLEDFDFGSDPVFRVPFEKARDTGAPVATPWRVGEENGPFELLLVLPVYRGGSVPNRKEAKRAAIEGFILATLRVDHLAKVLLAPSRAKDFSIEFLDSSLAGGDRVLHRAVAPATGEEESLLPSAFLPVHDSFVVKTSFGGRQWGIRTAAGEAYVRKYHSLSYWLVLPVGIALTLLIALYWHSILSYWTRMERVIEKRTRSLYERERNLEDLVRERTESLRWKTAFLEAVTNASQDGIVVTDIEGRETFRNEQAKLWQTLPLGNVPVSPDRIGSLLEVVKTPARFKEEALATAGCSNVCLRHEIELINDIVLDMYSSPVLGRDGAYYGRIWMFHDVTERKRAEETLRDSENKFRDLTEKSVLGIALIQDGAYRFVNARFASIHGMAISEMIDREVTPESVHPEDRQRIQGRMVEEAAEGHRPVEFRVVSTNGETRKVMGYATPTTYRMKPAVIVTLLDVTDQRQAEEAVRENQVRLAHATELAKIVYWELDEGKQEFIFDDAFYALYGTTAEREGGYRMARNEYFRRFLHPEDLARVMKFSDENRLRRGTELPASHEHRAIRRDDGRVMHVATRVRVVRDEEGRIVKVIGANQDITEQKRAEEAVTWKTAFLEAQVNSSIDGILVVAREGEVILRNQRLIDMWKVPEHIAQEKDARKEFGHALSMARHPKVFREKVIFLNSHPNETSREEVDLKDGTILDSYSCPVLGKDGTYYGRIWTFRDITELKRYWDMLEGLSNTDGLTELANRRRFDDFLDREWRRALRDRSPLSLILMDIDFFKEFNDNYGHLAGDDCLRRVAAILGETAQRPGDLVARYGGEEFACILPDTGSKGAAVLANKIRDGVKAANMPHFFSAIQDHVTLSFGVATITPEAGQSPSELVQLADSLLYIAKRNGRDQIRARRLALGSGRTAAK
jgi:diguanylate cyclase (GGDEF)-like protein/PAS domain S-box-containing protein